MSIAEALLTADDFSRLRSTGPLAELVRGRIVPVNLPTPRHGQICFKAARIVDSFARSHELGQVVTNDSGIITERDPDTVRGADVAYYSYSKIPKGPLPLGYLDVAPEVAIEVLSPDDRWPRLLGKISEYLEAGVLVVCVLDPAVETAQLYRSDRPADTFDADDELEFPEALPGFRVWVREFFE